MAKENATKNFSYLGIGRVVALFLQALFYLLFASILEPELYGRLNVILALAGTFATLSRFGLGFTIQVFQSKKDSTSSNQIKTLFLVSTTAASLILLPIDIFAALLCFGMSLFIMYQQDLLGLKKYKKFMISSLVRSSLFFVIPILLYYAFEIPGIVLGMAIASIIPSIFFFKDLKIKPFFDLKNRYKVLFQNFLVDTSGLSVMIDKLLISYLYGFFIVGVYQFNLQVLMALQVLPGVLFSYLISEEATGATHKKISQLVFLASIGIVVAVIVVSPIFVEEFFPKYSEGILALQIIVLTIIPQAIGAKFSAKLIARESTKIGYVSLINIATLLVIIAIFGEIYGLVGLSIAVLISTSIGVIITYFLYRNLKKPN